MSEAAHAKVVNYTWEDATEHFEAGLKVAVDKSQQRDVNIVSFSPYYVAQSGASRKVEVGW